MTALDLFSRDAGESSALDAISQTARDRIIEVIHSFGELPLTSDAVRDRLGYSVSQELELHGGALGAIFTALSKLGKIERLPYTIASQRKPSRGRRLQVWRNAV